MIYISGWISSYFSLFLTEYARYRGKFFYFLVILFLGSIAIFRGDVGTDTLTYESLAEAFRAGVGLDGLEPGFSNLILLLQFFIANDQLVVRAVSVILVAGLLFYMIKADSNEMYFLVAFYIPAYFYSYSMNGLRIGIASIFLLLMVQYGRRKKLIKSMLFSGLSISFHYSMIFSVSYVFMILKTRNIRHIINIFIFIFIMFSILFYFNQGYLLQKFELYSEFKSPSPLSGLGKVFPLMALLISVYFSRLPSPDRYKIILLSVVFCSVFYAICFYSYAGLRLLDLLLLAVPISILGFYERYNILFDRYIKIGLFFSGLLALVAQYRGWLIDYGIGETSFLPYVFIFD